MTAPTDRAGVVALMAKAVAEADGVSGDWLAIGIGKRAHYWHFADFAFTALEAAGLRVVPVEATEAMKAASAAGLLKAGGRDYWDADVALNAALAASPFAPPPEDTA